MRGGRTKQKARIHNSIIDDDDYLSFDSIKPSLLPPSKNVDFRESFEFEEAGPSISFGKSKKSLPSKFNSNEFEEAGPSISFGKSKRSLPSKLQVNEEFTENAVDLESRFGTFEANERADNAKPFRVPKFNSKLSVISQAANENVFIDDSMEDDSKPEFLFKSRSKKKKTANFFQPDLRKQSLLQKRGSTEDMDELQYFDRSRKSTISKNFGSTEDLYDTNLNSGKKHVPAEIAVRGEQATQAFLKALKQGKQKIFQTRLMIVGQDRAGKTSLRKRLTGQKVSKEEISTDGIDCSDFRELNSQKGLSDAWETLINEEKKFKKDYEISVTVDTVELLLKQSEEDAKVQVQSESPVFQTKPSGYKAGTRHISTARLTQTLTKDHIPESIETLIEESLSKFEDKDDNWIDNWLEVDKKEKIELLLKEFDKDHINSEVSLSIWDFAGQSLYYTTHQVFLTRRAIYLIVFNLCQDLDEYATTFVRPNESSDEVFISKSDLTNLDFIHFWLNSIYTFGNIGSSEGKKSKAYESPPVLLIGTHRGELGNTEEDREKRCQEKFNIIKQSLQHKIYRKIVYPTFFALENINGDENAGLQKLREDILKIAKQEPYMGEEIPTQWLRFQNKINDLVNSGSFYCEIDEIRQHGRNLGILNEEDIQTMLGFFHDLGYILYFNTEFGVSDKLKEFVILSPKKLIDKFKTMIGFSMDFASVPPMLLEEYKEYEENGIICESLINYCWMTDINATELSFLIEVMKLYDLMYEIKSSEHEKKYFLPTKMHFKSQKMRFLSPDLDSPSDVTLYIKFSNFLSDTLFQRLLIRVIAWTQESSVSVNFSLKPEECVFSLDLEHDIIVRKSSSTVACIEITLSRPQIEGVDIQAPQPEIVSKVKHFIDLTINDLQMLWMKKVDYKLMYACPCKTGHLQELSIFLDQSIAHCKSTNKRFNNDSIKKLFENDADIEAISLNEKVGSSIDIFISYNWDNKPKVCQLTEKLNKIGFQCWRDDDQLHAGHDLYERLFDALHSCKLVICCITSKYCISANCQREVSLACNMKKPIIPLVFENCVWGPRYASKGRSAYFLLSSLIYFNYFENQQQKFDEMLKTIRKYIPDKCHIQSTSTSPSNAKSSMCSVL